MSHYNTNFREMVASKMALRKWSVAELARRAHLKYTTLDTILKTNGGFTYDSAMRIQDALKGKRVNNEEGA